MLNAFQNIEYTRFISYVVEVFSFWQLYGYLANKENDDLWPLKSVCFDTDLEVRIMQPQILGWT